MHGRIMDNLDLLESRIDNLSDEDKRILFEHLRCVYEIMHPSRNEWEQCDCNPTDAWEKLAANSKYFSREECASMRENLLAWMDETKAHLPDGYTDNSPFSEYPMSLAQAEKLYETKKETYESELEKYALEIEVIREWETVHRESYPEYNPDAVL